MENFPTVVKWDLSWDLKEKQVLTREVGEENVFRAEGTACAKAL